MVMGRASGAVIVFIAAQRKFLEFMLAFSAS
jgi:hypothetical protein